MQNAIKNDYKTLGYFIFGALDKYRLITQIPHNKKGNLDKGKYKKQIKQAEDIQNELFEIKKKTKLTKERENNLIKLTEQIKKRHQAKQRGEGEFVEVEWHLLQDQSPQS